MKFSPDIPSNLHERKYKIILNLGNLTHPTAALTTLSHFHGSRWRWMEHQKMEDGRSRNRKEFSLEEMTELHKDTWFLGFCFKQIFRTMLKKFLENRKKAKPSLQSCQNHNSTTTKPQDNPKTTKHNSIEVGFDMIIGLHHHHPPTH